VERVDKLERALVVGDLSQLSPEQRAEYYARVCDSLGLNPYTRPFEYLTINGKLTLYARRDATDQLRRLHNISTEVVSREQVGDLYVVRVRATMPNGRSDEAVGAVVATGAGEALANAVMKAETKAKRRATLSIVGLGWLDESEVGGVAAAPKVRIERPGAPVEERAARGGEGTGRRDERPVALPAGRRRPDPLWRQHDALFVACKKAGIAVEAAAPGATSQELREWIARQRAELQRRSAA